MGVYVGGEFGGLIYLDRSEEDGSLALAKAWTASDFDEALQVSTSLVCQPLFCRARVGCYGEHQQVHIV